jgi:hypothetical protein
MQRVPCSGCSHVDEEAFSYLHCAHARLTAQVSRYSGFIYGGFKCAPHLGCEVGEEHDVVSGEREVPLVRPGEERLHRLLQRHVHLAGERLERGSMLQLLHRELALPNGPVVRAPVLEECLDG